MRVTPMVRQRGGTTALGVVLVLAGLAALALRATGVDVIEAITSAGWQLFVIVPGAVLMIVALLVPAPRGLGFAIGGTITASVGLLMLYQENAGHWESWAYAWALIGPGAAGLAMVWYGALLRSTRFIRPGLWLMAIGLALFAVGAWFFETLFSTGRVPFEMREAWPLIVIAAGVLMLRGGLLGRLREADRTGPAEERP